MHTFMGDRLDIEQNFTPTIKDIAVGLSREWRWGGATVVPWSVLQHMLAGHMLTEGEDPLTRAAFLFHDSEEFVTGDIPRGFKTPDQEELGRRVRKVIYQKTLQLPYPNTQVLKKVKRYDNVIARAEADCLVHPRARRSMESKWEGIEATEAAWDAVWTLMDVPERDVVKMFVGIATDMLANPKLTALRRQV